LGRERKLSENLPNLKKFIKKNRISN
jgi:hypothetical protein